MSQLSLLRQQILAISRQAKETAQALEGNKAKFSDAIGIVQSTLGGSSRSVDQELIGELQSAQSEVNSAIMALMSASKTADHFAQSL